MPIVDKGETVTLENFICSSHVETAPGEREGSFVTIELYCHRLLLLQKSYKVDAGGAGGRRVRESALSSVVYYLMTSKIAAN